MQAKGKLTLSQAQHRLALLSGTQDPGQLYEADLIIEAVAEHMVIKEATFRQMDAHAKPGAILVSTTCKLDVDSMAACTRRSHDVVGMHFFRPAYALPLLEITRAAHTEQDVLATVMALARKMRKTAVLSGTGNGLIGKRMHTCYLRQAEHLLDEGCMPEQVDRAAENFGFAMGPFRRHTACSQFDAMAAARSQGAQRRHMSDEEIVQRLVFGMVNEAAYILQEGIAHKASDIDVVCTLGCGFPAHRGGPLCYANELGLAHVVATMQRFAQNPQGCAQDSGQPARPLLCTSIRCLRCYPLVPAKRLHSGAKVRPKLAARCA